jgi:hypothetical protein
LKKGIITKIFAVTVDPCLRYYRICLHMYNGKHLRYDMSTTKVLNTRTCAGFFVYTKVIVIEASLLVKKKDQEERGGKLV